MASNRNARGSAAVTLLLTAGASLATLSCATLQQVAALRQVDFSIDRIEDARVAGIQVDRIRSYDDLSATQLASLGIALAQGRLPLEFRLHLDALNPPENEVTARLLEMDWSLFLDDRETVSGSLQQSYSFPPGQPQDIPITIRLDLLEFFDDNAADLIDLVAAATGQSGTPRRISLRARPTIDTPIGPIRYPQPITIVAREVGR
jgi:hypothetical protein